MEQQVDAATQDKLQASLSRARARFIGALEDRAEELYALLDDLDEPARVEPACVAIRAKVHKLHGLAGMIGFPRIGSLSVQLEGYLDLILAGSRPLNPDPVKELLDPLLAEIEDQLVAA